MNTDSKNIVNIDLKKDERILNFSDFQKQSISFNIAKLQEAYLQITQTKNSGLSIPMRFGIKIINFKTNQENI